MSERYDDRNDNPCLFEFEIRSLANIALTRGEIIDANHVDIQDPGRPLPHYFRLSLSPEDIDSSWRLQFNGNDEVITGVVIEYNEEMKIAEDDEPMEPWVTVSVTTKLYDPTSSSIIDRWLRYRLSLVGGGVCNVTEERSDEDIRADMDASDIADTVSILAQEARPLNEDDLKFLRALISQP